MIDILKSVTVGMCVLVASVAVSMAAVRVTHDPVAVGIVICSAFVTGVAFVLGDIIRKNRRREK